MSHRRHGGRLGPAAKAFPCAPDIGVRFPVVLPLFVPVPATPAAPGHDLTAGHTTDTSVAAEGSRHHTVRSGESAYDIARRYRVSQQALLSRNHLGSSDFIHPGQQLTIPATASSGGSASAASTTKARPARTGPTRSYTVRSGDTLTGIATRHGMSVERLSALNDLQRPHIITGEKLRVTGVTPKPAKRATSRPAATSTHTVSAGENLSGIAARRGMSVLRLAKLNHLSTSDVLHAGQTLKVTGPTRSSRSEAQPRKAASPKKTSANTFAGRTYSDEVVEAASRNRATLAERGTPSRTETRATITRIARQNGVDPSLALAVSYQESGWDHGQVSVANAVGTMQVIPSAGEWTSQLAGRELDLLDHEDNITSGVLLLKVLTQQASTTSDAIAGYYQGLASVEANGMYDDTKQYVSNVKTLRARM